MYSLITNQRILQTIGMSKEAYSRNNFKIFPFYFQADKQSFSVWVFALGYFSHFLLVLNSSGQLLCKVSYTKVEWVGIPYSCLHAFIQWHHAGLDFSSIYVIGHLAAPCMQARIKNAHSFYLGIDDFGFSERY